MEGVVRKGVWVVPGVGGGVSSIGGLGCGGLSDSYGDPGGGDIFSNGGDSDGIPCEGVIGGGETEEVTAAIRQWRRKKARRQQNWLCRCLVHPIGGVFHNLYHFPVLVFPGNSRDRFWPVF